MSGVKGRSGGARPGAGRKPKTPKEPGVNTSVGGDTLRAKAAIAQLRPELSDGADRDSLEFLRLVQNDAAAPLKDRIRAAIAAAQYEHTKRHDGGKKEAAEGRAATASKGRFGVRSAPLKVVGGADSGGG